MAGANEFWRALGYVLGRPGRPVVRRPQVPAGAYGYSYGAGPAQPATRPTQGRAPATAGGPPGGCNCGRGKARR